VLRHGPRLIPSPSRWRSGLPAVAQSLPYPVISIASASAIAKP